MAETVPGQPGRIRGRRGPTPRPVSAEQAEKLQAVVAAAERRRSADLDYREAIMAAHRAGVTNRAIATAIGVSDESVRQLVRRWS